jgi:hypothetical protein
MFLIQTRARTTERLPLVLGRFTDSATNRPTIAADQTDSEVI